MYFQINHGKLTCLQNEKYDCIMEKFHNGSTDPFFDISSIGSFPKKDQINRIVNILKSITLRKLKC